MDKMTPEQVVQTSKAHGLLAKQFYAVFTIPADPELMAKNVAAHLEYQIALEEKGIMFAAGPLFTDEGGFTGEGMIVIRAASLAEARSIAEADPMHSSGARTFRIRPWLVNEGSVSIRVNFSSGKFEID